MSDAEDKGKEWEKNARRKELRPPPPRAGRRDRLRAILDICIEDRRERVRRRRRRRRRGGGEGG